MSTFLATFAHVDNRGRSGVTQPVLQGRDSLGLTALTTDGTSKIAQRSLADWTATRSGNLTIRANGAVWVQVKAAPVAAAGADLYMASGERLELTVEVGDKIAVTNA